MKNRLNFRRPIFPLIRWVDEGKSYSGQNQVYFFLTKKNKYVGVKVLIMRDVYISIPLPAIHIHKYYY
jgi:hypothetical protein